MLDSPDVKLIHSVPTDRQLEHPRPDLIVYLKRRKYLLISKLLVLTSR